MTEHQIQDQIRRELCRGDTRVFRNNIGKCRDARGQWIQYGVPGPGGSDLLGWHSITITPEMINQRVAVFTAIEIKRPGQKPTQDQTNFITQVRRAGGFAGVATSIETAHEILSGSL